MQNSRPTGNWEVYTMPAADPIKLVIVLTLENRSFDHTLGCLQQVKQLDGISNSGPARTNEYAGRFYPQEAYKSEDGRFVVDDPMHEHPHVMVQLEKDAAGNDN